jgi:hypothetical protein
MVAVVKLYNRLIKLQESTAHDMDCIIKTIRGRHLGTVRWKDSTGREHIRRWTDYNMGEVVSEFTAAMVAYLYLGEENILSPESFKEYPIIIRYQWNDLYKEYYHGFKDQKALDKWLSYNDGWVQSFEVL